MAIPQSHRLSNRPQRLALHPSVYRALIGSAVCLFLSTWIFFGHNPYTALQLVIAGFFIAMFVGTPWLLARNARGRAEPDRTSFGEWREGDFQTDTGALPAGEAALMVMIAPVAVTVGMFAISLIAYLAAAGVY